MTPVLLLYKTRMLFHKVAVFYSRRQTVVCFLNKFFFIPKEWFRLVASLNTCLQLPGVLDHRDTLENISGAEELSITWIEESSQFFVIKIFKT